jgi:thiol:disulfide interchange protein
LLKRTLLGSLFILMISTVWGQILEPAAWGYEVSKKDVSVGEELDLIFNVDIDKDWYLYSSDFDPDLGPMVTEFAFFGDPSFELVGGIEPVGPKRKYDDIWEGYYTYFTKHAQFKQKIRVLTSDLKILGTYNYQVCTESDGKCIPFDDEFDFSTLIHVVGSSVSVDNSDIESRKSNRADIEATTPQENDKLAENEERAMESNKGQNENSQEDIEKGQGSRLLKNEGEGDQQASNITKEDFPLPLIKKKSLYSSLWLFFFVAFGSGFVALLTPCVFPMIPMTVSFFTHSSRGRGAAISKAIIFGLSIIGIYIILGFATSLAFGPEFANFVSTHWIPNVLFFLIFLVFAISFFGAFDIVLPTSLVNSMDEKADKGGIIGVFFLAFTLALVSFSCTGPIVGSILVASAGGEVIKPLVGMAGFSLAFAIPFTLFAAFPSWLNGLPKSGGWLNSVKVVLGFLELAFAFKFLSVADQTYHWGILDRHVYISIWIVIFTLLGFYLIGKIQLPHDSPVEKISVTRLLFSILTFSFVIYLIPGMFGAPLKALSGYLPPQSTHDFDLNELIRANSGGGQVASNSNICEPPKYANMLHLPHGLTGYFDLDQALECSSELGKPIFIDFTGHGCVNCREMEANVWAAPEVLERLKNDFIVVALYVDDKYVLPEEDWIVSEYDSKVKKSIGRINADLQITKFNNNAQPYYCLVDENGELLVEPKAYDLDIQNFVRFLDSGTEAFKIRSKNLTALN